MEGNKKLINTYKYVTRIRKIYIYNYSKFQVVGYEYEQFSK